MLPSISFGGLPYVCFFIGYAFMLLALSPFALTLIRWANRDSTKSAFRVPFAILFVLSFVGLVSVGFYLAIPK